MLFRMEPLLICLTLVTILFVQSTASTPIRKNDIIAGEEFLTIYIDHHKEDDVPETLVSSSDADSNLNSNSNSFLNKNIESDASLLPIEKMFNSSSEDVENTDEILVVDETSNRHHYKYQRRYYHRTPPPPPLKEVEQADDKIDNKTTISSNNNIRVITVTHSTSSSTHQSQSGDHHDQDDSKQFNSNSHKTDFSIDEVDPLTSQHEEDSRDDPIVDSESSQIHSIVVAPLSVDNPASNIAKSRTQRKQDNIIPYQSVIYHDNEDNNNSNNNLRPVSYSSVSQTIGEIRSWREYDSNTKPIDQTSQSESESHPKIYSEPSKVYSEPSRYYSEPSRIYSEPAKIYSMPAKVYGEPEKVYGIPSKIYSLPSKVYSEPSKIYSEPAKTYGTPSKVYSEPAKVYFESTIPTTPMPSPFTSTQSKPFSYPSISPQRKIIFNLDRLPYDLLNAPIEYPENENQQSYKNSVDQSYNYKNTVKLHQQEPNIVVLGENYSPRFKYNNHELKITTTTTSTTTIAPSKRTTQAPEENYEIDEAVSVMTNGRVHGVQSTEPTNLSGHYDHNLHEDHYYHKNNDEDDSRKVGYVLEGRNYRKYRVEEKTPDGFIVGEYGVVSHNDGSLRGVRYTADSNINPKLIYDALQKFLSL